MPPPIEFAPSPATIPYFIGLFVSTFHPNRSPKNCCCAAGSRAWISQCTTRGPLDLGGGGGIAAARRARVAVRGAGLAATFFAVVRRPPVLFFVAIGPSLPFAVFSPFSGLFGAKNVAPDRGGRVTDPP